MFQITLTKSDGIGWEIHMIVGEAHIQKNFDTDDEAKKFLMEMVKDYIS